MDDDHHTRLRAIREDVAATRAGRAAARPLVIQLAGWQQAAARLGARLEHARAQKLDCVSVVADIEQLSTEIRDGVAAWHATISTTADVSGHVEDAERASAAVLALVESLRRRI